MIPNHQRIIDSALLALNVRALELVVMLEFPINRQQAESDQQRERLRASMAGYHLRRIAEYAEGEEHVTGEAAQESINAIYKLLFASPYREDKTPPPDFHRSDLGRLINEAYIRLIAGEELLTPTEAYRALGISRQAVYNNIEAGKLTPIYLYGKTMLLARQVEELRAKRRQGQKTSVPRSERRRKLDF
jgi:hypothetical protein